MKIFKRIITLSLAAIMLFASACSSCGGNKEEENNNHGGTVTDAEGFIVEDGKTDYVIAIPQEPQSLEKYAAEDFQKLFLEATGLKLEIVSDALVEKTDKFFSVGRTTMFASTGVKVDKYELKDDGFKLFTEGDNIYMCGGEETGTLYAVYEYLYRELNFEQFYSDCYTLNKDVKEIPLRNYDITEIPDIAYRAGSYAYLDSEPSVRRRMRVSGKKFDYFTSVGMPCHNSFKWLSLDEHYAKHPEWYADNMEQLCYTAHGNETSLEAMADAALERFKEVYASSPDTKCVTLTMEDAGDNSWCGCDTCRAEMQKYSTNAAVVIKFLNKLSKKMETYVTSLHADEEGYKYDIDLVFFAYKSATAAPVKLNADTGEYEPIDDSVVCDSHVAPWYAPIYYDYTQSINSDVNASYREYLKGWSALSEKIYMWVYETNFNSYMSYYETLNGMPELFKTMADVKVKFLFNQSQFDNEKGATAWHLLKGYLTAKLSWDSSQNMETLIQRFFDAMYGPAAETMNTWFVSTRTYVQSLVKKGLYTGLRSVYTDSVSSDYWTYQILELWQNYAAQAVEDIKAIKEVDADLYQSYLEHIVNERVGVNFLMLELYETNLTKEQAKALYDGIISDAAMCGITRYRESTLLSDWADAKTLID